MFNNILDLSQGDFNRLPDVEKLFLIKECFLDVLDGNYEWYDIGLQTGLDETRCKEISFMFKLCRNMKGRMI